MLSNEARPSNLGETRVHISFITLAGFRTAGLPSKDGCQEHLRYGLLILGITSTKLGEGLKTHGSMKCYSKSLLPVSFQFLAARCRCPWATLTPRSHSGQPRRIHAFQRSTPIQPRREEVHISFITLGRLSNSRTPIKRWLPRTSSLRFANSRNNIDKTREG